ncbi:glutathione S-transferase family protein [Pseudenhygromyxa sp. WMMC2535]|uniref:glutathione S-transferase n=1 Tax=Pseudenhygromyxa sp. WMMC2535 TaxID=2712867 RepID=UPI0015560553|nr:glutathione S-transferase [Pseudenhygromyxa sp. WMMC2535]NVB43062.1 glutathione S-transferase family protein [Pseudenhygromyxa sp. WMMC2535]
MSDEPYLFYYWPGLPGRGEFVRLILEQAGAAYRDVVREHEDAGAGISAMFECMGAEGPGPRPLAPPFLVHGELRLAQMPNICAYLGARHGLAPADEAGRLTAMQHQLTLADLVNEAHDTHHPVAVGQVYEEQKVEAARYTKQFLAARMPKFLGYFETLLQAGGGRYLVGDALSYVDLSMNQVLRGLEYAFPRGFAALAGELPGLLALRDRVDALEGIAAYRASPRCQPFCEHGIFRRYPELDLPG